MCQRRYSSTQRRPNTANYQHKFVSCPQQQEEKRRGWFQSWLEEGGGAAVVVAAVVGELNLGMFILQLGEHFENTEQRRVVLFFCARSSHSLWPRSSHVPSHEWCEPVKTYNSDSDYKKKLRSPTPGVPLWLRRMHILYRCMRGFVMAAEFVIVLIIKKYLSRSFCFRPGAWLKNAWYFSDKTVLLIHRKQWNLGVLLWKMFKTGGL